MHHNRFWEHCKMPKEVTATSLLLTSGSQDLLKCKDVWIGDTSATQHSTFSSIWGRNQRTCNVLMKGQIGEATTNVTLIYFSVELQDVSGKQYGRVIFKDVQVKPKFNNNLGGITKLLKNGFHSTGDSNGLYVVRY